MDNSFFDALSLLGSENNVDIAQLVEKVKSAMLKAARKAYPECEDNITVEIDPATKKFEMYVRQTVVDDEPIDANEVNIDVARTVDPNAYVGGTIDRRLDIAKFGRAAAQSAKQSIKGDLREINRERILGEFESLENDCITCEVSRVETNGTATLLYHKTELYLFPNEQIPGETLREGQRVKVYITTIANKQKKPIIKISRVRKELVKRLFELEIPEIYDGTVEIKSISREAGSRTKVAVWSKDENVDAIGACIGPKRSRISAIVAELNGEKIDIIPYSEKPEEFIAKALAPATVLDVQILSEEERTCTVKVPNNQLSLAIGNKGQNAKLAAKLTGYKIDIKPEFDVLTKHEHDAAPAEQPEAPQAEQPAEAAAEAPAETAETEANAPEANSVEEEKSSYAALCGLRHYAAEKRPDSGAEKCRRGNQAGFHRKTIRTRCIFM